MAESPEMRRLAKKWSGGAGWPKRLNWLEVKGLRGWEGERLDLGFPIIAIVGENGSGKSSLLQSAACVYRAEQPRETRYASEFFPDTAWDMVTDAYVRFGYSQGPNYAEGSIRKPTTRWLGNVDRPIRDVRYIDLNRIQPVSARVGYAKIAKTRHKEASSKPFNEDQVARLSAVMGRHYDSARMALSDVDGRREVPVISKGARAYSGFHQGSGETTVAELLQADLPKYGLILIDELESSLHPRAQRRLIRDLAARCRELELQIVITTHSPYILDELPLEARKYILETNGGKRIVSGVSPEFAMTQMDDEQHPECDVYVEDEAAQTMVAEVLAAHAGELFVRCSIVPYGGVSVGQALGLMVAQNRFPRPTTVFLDGDSAAVEGCHLLPGDDAPEQVVFAQLQQLNWANVWAKVGRDVATVSDALAMAMTLPDHHHWVRQAANKLMIGKETLWRAMCAEWAAQIPEKFIDAIVQPIEEVVN